MSFLCLDRNLPFRHPSVLPPRSGMYVRDWRGTSILPESDRILSVDWWHLETSRLSILWPGVWFVLPGPNDASIDRLPWRELTVQEAVLYGPLWDCMREADK